MYHQDKAKPKKIQSRTIRALIRARYGSITAFCALSGFSRPSVYGVIRGARWNEPRARYIAQAIGKQPHELWPKWFPTPTPDSHEPAA